MSSSTPQQKADPPANPIHVSAGETPVPAAVAAAAGTTTSPDHATNSSADARAPAAVASPLPAPAAPLTATADDEHHHLNQPLIGESAGGIANINNEDVIEAVDDNHSVDSNEFEPEEWDAGSSNASTSISSSVYNHTFENGRRYHSYRHGRYPIPNDDLEQSREDMKHAMMLEMTDGKLFYAPVGDYPQKIIDIGTGTGIWAIEVGDQFASAEVMGIDLSPIQPVWLPPNVKFLIDDCEDEWLNGDGWDLVHFRTMSAVLKNVPKMCEQVYANLKPGGWVEWQELHAWMQCDDGTMPPNDPAFDFYKLFQQAFRRIGCDTALAANLDGPLRDAGFVNVQCVVKKIPVGQWARDKKLRLAGWYLRTAIQEVLPALCGKPLSVLGLNEVERELWRAAAVRAVNDDSVHRYWNMYFWYAQKPE
ncbi:S-adenosyl-L-methionine-dependent methyltransferase [Apiospora marii]|uniref:S-adenosyl-L-methionine-dependent methyltransferase n=1 Tax=Apiospora marii TaxID=335849 RepID=UPI00312E12B7